MTSQANKREIKPEAMELSVLSLKKFYKEREFKKALDYVTEAIAMEPEFGYFYFLRAEFRFICGNWRGCRNDLDQAVRLDSDKHSPIQYRAWLRFIRKDYEGAIEDFDKARAIPPYLELKCISGRGRIKQKMGDFLGAYIDFTWCAENLPKYPEAYFYRAMLAYKFRLPQISINDFGRAIEKDPNFISAYYQRGLVFFDIGEYEKAINDLSKAISLFPLFRSALWLRAKVFFKQDLLEEAEKDLMTVINLCPAHKEARILKRKISRIKKTKS